MPRGKKARVSTGHISVKPVYLEEIDSKRLAKALISSVLHDKDKS
jgi:hypothetical protein